MGFLFCCLLGHLLFGNGKIIEGIFLNKKLIEVSATKKFDADILIL